MKATIITLASLLILIIAVLLLCSKLGKAGKKYDKILEDAQIVRARESLKDTKNVTVQKK